MSNVHPSALNLETSKANEIREKLERRSRRERTITNQ